MNPFQNSPKDESRCRTQPERSQTYTEEELDRALNAAGSDWDTAQQVMAAALGIDPDMTGPLDKATVIICTPWSATPKMEGIVRHRCDSCRSLLAMSPKSRDAVKARPELAVLCLPCALKQIEQQKESEK